MNEFNRNLKIGIAGCGHLGLGLARTFIAHGIDKSHLKLSHGGSPATLAAIREAGLGSCVSATDEVFSQSDIVFITLRPDSIGSLRGLVVNKRALHVSCVAGVECGTLEKIIGTTVIRLMPSSPQSIEAGTGIAALWPNNDTVSPVLSDLNVDTIILDDEKQLHFFTALVCLPAAYLQMETMGLSRQEPDAGVFSGYGFAQAGRVVMWAREHTPVHLSPGSIADYIFRMATKGGITETIVESIKNGGNLNTALLDGIERGEEIAAHYRVSGSDKNTFL